MNTIESRCWVMADDHIPAWSLGREPEMTSHEAVCLLGAGDREAHVEITV